MRFIGTAILILAANSGFAQTELPGFGFEDNVLTPQVELPPRYRIEFIIFEHNRFSELEEYFDVVPPLSLFAAEDGLIPMRDFDADARQALRDAIEGPILPPPPEEPAAEILSEVTLNPELQRIDPEAVLAALRDPRLIEGPASRYLDLDELALLPMLDRLERLDAYTPLVHGGWEQNGLIEEEAVPVALAEFGSSNPRGTIRLHMSRFLHIHVDLAWRDEPLMPEEALPPVFGGFQRPAGPAPTRPSFGLGPVAAAAPEPREFYLFEQRRVLRGELNYFDHPAFGLLLQITLAPEPAGESPEEADGPSA